MINSSVADDKGNKSSCEIKALRRVLLIESSSQPLISQRLEFRQDPKTSQSRHAEPGEPADA